MQQETWLSPLYCVARICGWLAEARTGPDIVCSLEKKTNINHLNQNGKLQQEDREFTEWSVFFNKRNVQEIVFAIF